MLTRTIKAKLPPNVVQKFGCLSMENYKEDLIYTELVLPVLMSFRYVLRIGEKLYGCQKSALALLYNNAMPLLNKLFRSIANFKVLKLTCTYVAISSASMHACLP